MSDGVWWHCKTCGRLFRTEPDRVRVSCIECRGGPVVQATERLARLAESGCVRSVTFDSKRGVSK